MDLEYFEQTEEAYYADWIVAPVLIFAAAVSAGAMGAGLGGLLVASAGFVLWEFAEYAIHRWAFHGPLKRYHFVHHRRPHGYTSVSPLLSGSAHLLVLGAMLAVLGLAYGFALFAGWMIGYFWYLFVHDSFHHHSAFSWWRRQQAWLVQKVTRDAYWRHHVHHEDNVHGYYGIAFPWFDWLFGTWCKR